MPENGRGALLNLRAQVPGVMGAAKKGEEDARTSPLAPIVK